jgi:hypothetical protein
VVKESGYYSNVHSVFRFDDQITNSSTWTGTVQLYLNGGSMLLLEDVLYDAGAHTSVVSLLKLNEASMFTDFNGAGATIYNAVDNRPVSHAIMQDIVNCLEDLAPPPPAMKYPSRPTVEVAPPATTPQVHSPIDTTSSGSRSGISDFIGSAWASHSNLPHLPATTSKLTYPPFESATKSTPTVPKEINEVVATGTLSPTIS